MNVYVYVKARVFVHCIARRHVHGGMGSLREVTLRAHCRTHAASYIPDGCIGPLCMNEEHCCYEWAMALGWEVIEEEYLRLVETAWHGRLGKRVTLPLVVFPLEVALRVCSFMWRTT